MSNNDRFNALDGMRGAAAVVVVLHHCWRAVHSMSPPWLVLLVEGPLSILNAGHFAVMLFFVLSGFVLARPWVRGENPTYFDFALRRICRLYPPAAAVVMIAAILFAAVNAGLPLPVSTDIILNCWSTPIGIDMFERHLALSGYPASSVTLDPPLWSLVVELRASLVFPLLVLMTRRYGWSSILVGVAAAFACGKLNSTLGELSPYTTGSFVTSMLLTGRYLVFFIIGINIAFCLRPIQACLRRIPVALHVALCAAIYLANATVVMLHMDGHGVAMLAFGAFASYLIACCTVFRAPARLLELPLLAWLGSISFSLYLVHLPVMMAMLYALSGLVSLPVTVALSLPVMFLAAVGMQHTVFGWSARLGQRGRMLTKNIQQVAEGSNLRGD